jgi:hypothetical protein
LILRKEDRKEGRWKGRKMGRKEDGEGGKMGKDLIHWSRLERKEGRKISPPAAPSSTISLPLIPFLP